MAIYSLRHSPVGKTTQKQPFTAAAHISYITRPKALSALDGERMPVDRKEARAWFTGAEETDRKNARVADKIMLALPKELSSAERVALVRAFAETLTQGRASWLAAFHERGKDQKNPHCHLVVRDRDPETGKRVIGMSEGGSTLKLRELWEEATNRALARAGLSERVDRRSLAAQGVDRKPTIHEGPRAQAMHRRGKRPQSKPRVVRNGPGARTRVRTVHYQQTDNGRSRPAYNAGLRAAQAEQAFWLDIDRDRLQQEISEQERIHRPDRYDEQWLSVLSKQDGKYRDL